MDSPSRHLCLVYEGPPSQQLPALVAATREKLKQNCRCLYLNSPTMVVGMGSYLAASGVDVAREVARGGLVLSSERHLIDDYRFDVQLMIDSLQSALEDALQKGFSGLWATGDMTWEFGPQKDFSSLLEYEWHLEEFMNEHPEISGICQYRADLLPRSAMRNGLVAHPTIFVNETLSRLNPQYIHPNNFTPDSADNPELDGFINELISQETLS